MCANISPTDGLSSIALASSPPSGTARSRLTRMVLFRSHESNRAARSVWSDIGPLVHLNQNRNVELGIVLLHVAGPILLAEFLHHRRDPFGISNSNGLKFSICAARIDPNFRVLEHVLVPLRIRPLHRQEVKRRVLEYEPDRDRDTAS